MKNKLPFSDLVSKTLIGGVYFLMLSIQPQPAKAEFITVSNETSEFRLFDYDGQTFLQLPISSNFGSMNGIDRGVEYISCVPNRIDSFRFNVVLDSSIPNHFMDQVPIFIGIRKLEENGTNTVGSIPTHEVSSPPEEFGFLDYTEFEPFIVRDYDQFGISSFEKLYLRSRISAQFFQKLQDNQKMLMVVHQRDDMRYMFVFSIQYELSAEVANRFLSSCLQQGEAQ